MKQPVVALHPGAWWLFGMGLLVGTSQVGNPLLNLVTIAALSFVVSLRRPLGRFGNPFLTALKVGGFLILFRVVLAIAFGARTSGTVLVKLPEVSLPSWLAGVSLGGPVTTTLLVQAFCLGLSLATVLAIFGACSTLAPPERLLQSLPRAMYEVGLSLAIALAFLPELVASAQALKAARRLRGRPTKGLAGLRGTLVPILEGALERSVTLAASMDARGFGRTSREGKRLVGQVVALISLGALIVGGTGLLAGAPQVAVWVVLLLSGSVGLIVALQLRSAVLLRTAFEEQRFTGRSIVLALLGLLVGIGILVAGHLHPTLLDVPSAGSLPVVTPGVLVVLFGVVVAGLVAPKVPA